MKSLIRHCVACRIYTMKPACPRCGARTNIPIPARFSLEDHYGEYRRKLKSLELGSYGRGNHKVS